MCFRFVWSTARRSTSAFVRPKSAAKRASRSLAAWRAISPAWADAANCLLFSYTAGALPRFPDDSLAFWFIAFTAASVARSFVRSTVVSRSTALPV
eukprot:gene22607-biopygen22936